MHPLSLYLMAFLVGGAICVFGQLFYDMTKLTPAHVMTILVIAGAILEGFGVYDGLIHVAGAGVTVPITSFGHSLVHGAMLESRKDGWIGLLTGIFEITSAGISSAILFGFLGALFFRARG